MRLNPLTCIDFYKADHRRQYPAGTTLVYANLTARSAKYCGIPEALFTGKVTFFGLQFFIKDFLQDCWNEEFFKKPKQLVIDEYKHRLDNALGKDSVPLEHVGKLHDLGYLPIAIRALPEGTQVPVKVPCLVLYNTHPEFFWLTNYLESVMSAYLWKPTTAATIAKHYRVLLEKHADQTGSSKEFVNFQAHDFSLRGMSGPHDAALTGAAHLTSFAGTDSVPAIDLVERYYGAMPAYELVGCSVPATEHSVMCMGGQDDELGTFKRLITELYPAGVVSVVSDTWDFWKVITDYASALKADILARDGKVVFRPDSGDPIKIICGDPDLQDKGVGTPQEWAKVHGAVEALWHVFGGTTNAAGYKVLNPKVGLIYGDSITLERAHLILKGLRQKGFAASSVVFGVGSFTYQHVTRDTFGFAVKATYGEVRGEAREIFKDPVTDDGVKKSARGLLKVVRNEAGELELHDRQLTFYSADDVMREVFRDGKLLIKDTLASIRKRARGEEA